MPNKYDEKLKKEVVQYYLDNDLSVLQVERKFDLGTSVLYGWIDKFGARKKKPRPKKYKANGYTFSEKDRKEAYKRFKKGESIAEISISINCGESTIKSWIKKYDAKEKEFEEEHILDSLMPELSQMKKQIGEKLLVEYDKYNSILTDAENKLKIIIVEMNRLNIVK